MPKSKHRPGHKKAKANRNQKLAEKEARRPRMIEVGKGKYKFEPGEEVEGFLEVGLNPEPPK